jgi:dihydroorotase
MIRLPGLIDVHVHLREPGQTDKEDFATGTRAAVAGGFTHVVDMPNNAVPCTTPELLDEKIRLAQQKAVCDLDFHYGSLGDNLDTFETAAKKAIGLKLYLNLTTGGFILDVQNLRKIYAAWPENKPILLHVEEDVIDTAIESLADIKRPVHVCHMPSADILTKIMTAKDKGLPISCGVTPHHLFLNDIDAQALGNFGQVKPSLKPQKDVDFLWQHLDAIDIIESDHAPHTVADKQAGAFGFPGLETTLPLLLQAEREGKISRQRIIELCHTEPARIFGLKTSDETYIEVAEEEWKLDESKLQTKCKWSPFRDKTLFGKVQNVVIRGRQIVQDSELVV